MLKSWDQLKKELDAKKVKIFVDDIQVSGPIDCSTCGNGATCRGSKSASNCPKETL